MAIDFRATPEKKKEAKATEIIPKQTFPLLDLEAAKKRFTQYIEKIDGILKEAQDLKVETDETNQKAVEVGTSAKILEKQIDEVRIRAISEPYTFVKSVNAFAKIFTDKLGDIETLMKQKISTYRAFQEQKRREAELAAKKATEDLQKKLNKEAEKTGTAPVQVVVPIIPKQESVTRSETGTAYGRKHWTFKIVNKELIPHAYMIPNEGAIRKAMNAGIRDIPGVEFYEEDITSFRT